MKKIFLLISSKPLKATEEDMCWYAFDEDRYEDITEALDKIQEDEAESHYETK